MATNSGSDPSSSTTGVKRKRRRYEKAKLLKSRVKRLEKKLELYDRRIKQVMEADVSLEEMDSDTSAYLQEDMLKRRFLKTWVELCDLLQISPEVQVGESSSAYSGTQHLAINKRVERLLKHGEFPDYWDVCQLVKRANEKHGLNIAEKDCQSLSRKVFVEVGEALKKQRLKMWDALSGCHLTDGMEKDSDPALSDPTLSTTLTASLSAGRKSLNSVYDKFAYLQEQEGDETASSTNEEEDLDSGGTSGINGCSTSLKHQSDSESDTDEMEAAQHDDSITHSKGIIDNQQEHKDTCSSDNDQVYLVDGSEEEYESPPTPMGNGDTSLDRLAPSGDENVIVISD